MGSTEEILVRCIVAGQVIGALSGLATCLGWSAAMWGPSGVVVSSGTGFTAALPMMFLGICAVIASLRAHGVALIIIFVASFFPVGWILATKLSDHFLHWVGLLNLGYLVAGLMICAMGKTPQSE